MDKYILVITVPYVSYYDQYFVIDKDEYNLWKENVEKLDTIAGDSFIFHKLIAVFGKTG